MNHREPNPTLKRYLDAEGKWQRQSLCICRDCQIRRAEQEKVGNAGHASP
jgi:hypothetical protein